MKTRIYFLDNLRTFLILMVVVLHSGLVYEHVLQNSWIVVDPVKCNSIGLLRMYLDLFVMFCIFFISGYFIPNSVRTKTACQFIQSKLRRIMLPWGIAVFTLIPAYKAIFLFSRGLPQEEWFSSFHFFERAGADLSFFADNPTQNWLWFLPVLFVFQLLYLALYKLNLLSFKISIKQGVAFTFVVGFIYASLISLGGYTGWTHSILLDFQNERLLVYLSAFLLGSLFSKLNVFENWQRNTRQYIWVNVVMTVVLGIFTAIALNLFFNLITPDRNYFFISGLVDRFIYHATAMLSMLCFLYVLLYSFRFSLNKTNGVLSQLGRSSYTVYIIHTVVLGLLALVLLKLNIPSWIKFIVLAGTTFVVSNFLIYAWQKAKQRPFSLKTAGALGTSIVLVLFAFSGQPVTEINSVEIEKTEVDPTVVSIHAAVISGNLDAVKQLVNQGIDINLTEPEGGSTPLILAALFNKPDIAKFLIDNGADLNFRNNDGSTALHTAAFFCRTEIVSQLLEHGADSAVRNSAGSTALESIVIPFESVRGIYEYFGKIYAPLGLTIDLDEIEANRPRIVELLEM
ncbi:acyltransferase family protein [Mangrovibacterium lignilyticum]|uniref:acyltransferase family protein n=1 Tax=Mangrovibacterium lignilyticum TaxID=2668052 RepID=UPI0013D3B204|nr:acyltransferase family protein [Mangrovibacterium lignilyticum]